MWTNEIVLRLIDLYRSYEHLWDTANDGYKNKVKKNDTWEEIAILMDLPRREVEMKIHSLRSQFIRERKKIKAALETGGVVRPSSWFAYNPLMFLIKDDNCGIDAIFKQDINQDSQSTNDSELDTNHTQETVNIDVDTQYDKDNRNRPKIDRKRTYEDVSNNTSYKYVYNTDNKKITDEFDIYAQYIASELRHVKTERGRTMTKYHINNIILEARLGKYDTVRINEDISLNNNKPCDSNKRRKDDEAGNLVVEIKCERGDN